MSQRQPVQLVAGECRQSADSRQQFLVAVAIFLKKQMIFFVFLSLIRTFADHTTLFLYEKKISFENSIRASGICHAITLH
jgi:hypothetical protein